MEYRVAVVIQPKNTTDLAGTIVFGEHIKDLGTVLCMVTPEHDVIPFADNDQPKIDRMIKNILTEGDFPTLSDEQYMKNSTNLPPFELSGDPSIMIVKKGGESFVHNDIEKYVEKYYRSVYRRVYRNEGKHGREKMFSLWRKFGGAGCFS